MPKISNPMKSHLELAGASAKFVDLRGKAYETVTIQDDYQVVEVMAPGYVPSLPMDEHVDLFVMRLRVFVAKHKAYTPGPADLMALFVQGNQIARNPARRVMEALKGKKK